VYPVLALYSLCAIGGLYQTIGETLDRRHPASGQLVDVGGYRLHLQCEGAGTPVVLLESGLGETAAYWKWIRPAVASHTTVCAYDRAGRGWSEAAGHVQDAHAVATDLHSLLSHAAVKGPFVLVGHSSGAQYVRVFAGRYPEALAGMVLLDGQPAEAFEGLPAYPSFYGRFRRIVALLPSLARIGLARAIRAEHVSASHYRSLRDEFIALPSALAQARSFQNLGGRPLAVVTAAIGALAGWMPLQERMATLSSNGRHRVVPYAHDALVTDPTAAQVSIDAIRDVVNAVRSHAPLSSQ
jgi:pimeloyl-ACP methyl ester carboxylesterase